MTESLRRAFNAVERLFDRRALTVELRCSQSDAGSGHPVTALEAYRRVRSAVLALDRRARLKAIVSQDGIAADGTSAHWEFAFDLPRRRAQALCEWALGWDEVADGYGPAAIGLVVSPFPPATSPIRWMVEEGQLHRMLIGLWEQERRRRPDLPETFRDTDAAAADFARQGLDVTQVEFALATGLSPEGRPCWIARARRRTYTTPLDAPGDQSANRPEVSFPPS